MHDKSAVAREMFGAETMDAVREVLAVRHHWLNQRLEELLEADPECTQVVLLASGLDVRAYFLPCLKGAHVFEFDQGPVLRRKNKILAGDRPISATLTRVPGLIDASGAWLQQLRDAVCHKAAYCGYRLVNIEQSSTDGLGSPGSLTMRDGAKRLVREACERADRRGLRSRVVKALWAFRLAHKGRQVRCAQPLPICVETHGRHRSHEYQMTLMLALRDACHEWLHT